MIRELQELAKTLQEYYSSPHPTVPPFPPHAPTTCQRSQLSGPNLQQKLIHRSLETTVNFRAAGTGVSKVGSGRENSVCVLCFHGIRMAEVHSGDPQGIRSKIPVSERQRQSKIHGVGGIINGTANYQMNRESKGENCGKGLVGIHDAEVCTDRYIPFSAGSSHFLSQVLQHSSLIRPPGNNRCDLGGKRCVPTNGRRARTFLGRKAATAHTFRLAAGSNP